MISHDVYPQIIILARSHLHFFENYLHAKNSHNQVLILWRNRQIKSAKCQMQTIFKSKYWS